jgi:hypothetical protein
MIPLSPIRSTEMSLFYESLARAQHQERLAEADQERLVRRVVRARRALRRAERAALRSRLALAL